jgi:hypothetical protein
MLCSVNSEMLRHRVALQMKYYTHQHTWGSTCPVESESLGKTLAAPDTAEASQHRS